MQGNEKQKPSQSILNIESWMLRAKRTKIIYGGEKNNCFFCEFYFVLFSVSGFWSGQN